MKAMARIPAAAPATASVLGAIIATGAGADTSKAPSLSTICEMVDERMAEITKTGTAKNERVEKRDTPHRPCPEVHPLPSAVPTPSTTPHMNLLCGCMGWDRCKQTPVAVSLCRRVRPFERDGSAYRVRRARRFEGRGQGQSHRDAC